MLVTTDPSGTFVTITVGGQPARIPVEGIAHPSLGAAKSITTGASSARVQLSATTHVVRLTARGNDVRYATGDNTVMATGTSHYLGPGQTITLSVAPGSYIAAIQQSAAGALEITEFL